METTDRDGILYPKRLQDRCIELLSCLIVESLQRTVGEQHSHVQQEEHKLQQQGQQEKGRALPRPSHFQDEDGESIYRTLRHLRSYIGIERVLGAEGTLSAHFCDQILAYLSSKIGLTDQLVGLVCHRSFGCTTKFPSSIKPCSPLMLSTVQILVQQPLVDLSIDLAIAPLYPNVNEPPISWRDLSIVLGNSSACFTLRSLSLSHVRLTDPGMTFQCLTRLQRLMRLQFSRLILPREYTISELTKLPHLTVFSVTHSNLHAVPCKNVSTLKQLTLSNAPLHTNLYMVADILLLRNLVSLDIARTSLGDNQHSTLQHSDWIMKLSQMPQLKYLDVSGHLVSIDDMVHFDPPRHRMNFLGLLSTQACMRRDINSDVVSLCTL